MSPSTWVESFFCSSSSFFTLSREVRSKKVGSQNSSLMAWTRASAFSISAVSLSRFPLSCFLRRSV